MLEAGCQKAVRQKHEYTTTGQPSTPALRTSEDQSHLRSTRELFSARYSARRQLGNSRVHVPTHECMYFVVSTFAKVRVVLLYVVMLLGACAFLVPLCFFPLACLVWNCSLSLRSHGRTTDALSEKNRGFRGRFSSFFSRLFFRLDQSMKSLWRGPPYSACERFACSLR